MARYNEGEKPEGYQMGAKLFKCAVCARNDNSDRNVSLQIGNKFFARYGIILKEKPPALAETEMAEQSAGGISLQDANVPTVSHQLFGTGMRATTSMALPQNGKLKVG